MNRVEIFRATNSFDLEETINLWCKNNDYEPLSISLTHCTFGFVAAVVVRDLHDD